MLTTDRAIGVRVKAIFGLLRSAPSARATFVRGEHLWLQYRRAACTAGASSYEGGSAQPVEYLSCTVGRNKTHLTDLATIRRTLSQH